MGRTCNSGIHVSYIATAQEHLSTSRVLSSEISARDASSDVVFFFFNELLHKSNGWQMLFLSCNYTFSFTNYVERQASFRTVATLSYVSVPLLTRSLVLNAQLIPWQAWFIQQGLCKAFSNHLLSPPQEDQDISSRVPTASYAYFYRLTSFLLNHIFTKPPLCARHYSRHWRYNDVNTGSVSGVYILEAYILEMNPSNKCRIRYNAK